MASVDRNTLNPVEVSTDVHANTAGKTLFNGEYVFVLDAHPAFASTFPIGTQNLDAAYGRALNTGRGVVGEGGDKGPGVVGIAGGVIANPAQPMPRPLKDGPKLGRNIRAGVIGFGADPAMQGERGGQGDAAGVMGLAEKSVGVFGFSRAQPGVFGFANAHAGVFGASGTTGVIGDGRSGQIGVEGVCGGLFGVFGHVNFATPAANMIGVVGAAAVDLSNPKNFTGRAGFFFGPVDVSGNLTVNGDFVVFGTKSAAAKHRDGSHRLMYCMESPESLFEDFGEARLAGGAAEVTLDADFAAIADTRSYHVFLTPYGDCNGLFVVRRSRSGFRVRELGRGKSSIDFGYRVVARRKDVATKRFARVERPAAVKLPAGLEAPALDFGSLTRAPTRKREGTRAKR